MQNAALPANKSLDDPPAGAVLGDSRGNAMGPAQGEASTRRWFLPVETKAQYTLTRETQAALVAGDYYRVESLLQHRLGRMDGTADAGEVAGTAASLRALGQALLDRGDVALATKQFRKSLEVCQHVGDDEGVASSRICLGDVARTRRHYHRAAALYEQALTGLRGAGDRRGTAWALAGLAGMLRRLGDPRRARALYEQSLLLGSGLADRNVVMTGLAGLGGLALDRRRARVALRLFAVVEGSTDDAAGLGRPDRRALRRDVAAARRLVGAKAAARITARWRAAPAHVAVAWVHGSGAAESDVLVHQMPTVEEIIHKLRYHAAALDSQSEAAQGGIFAVAADGTVAQMNRRFVEMWGIPPDVARDRRRDAITARLLELVADPDGMLARGDYLHRHPDEAISADIRLRDGRVFEHYSAPIIGMDGTRYGRVGYYQDVTQRERDTNQIAAQEAQLRAQVAALQESRALITQAEERQRREIAELLHGRVQTKLVVVEYRLDQALALMESDPPAAAALLRHAQAEVAEVREHEVRQASHLLHPTVISVGLVPALAILADRFRGSLSLGVALSPIDADRIAALPEPVALGAYRVVEEALVNALRHGNARSAEVSLGFEPDGSLFVAIRDDGHGFDTAAAVSGMGFHVIGARVEQFGGEWTVESSVGEGTTLRARFRV